LNTSALEPLTLTGSKSSGTCTDCDILFFVPWVNVKILVLGLNPAIFKVGFTLVLPPFTIVTKLNVATTLSLVEPFSKTSCKLEGAFFKPFQASLNVWGSSASAGLIGAILCAT